MNAQTRAHTAGVVVEAHANDAQSSRTNHWRWAAVIVALWIPATLFFGGRLGWWNDDYLFNGRDPASGNIEFLVQRAPDPFSAPAAWQFWRPLNFATTTTLVTTFWNHDWIVHAIGAIAHLLATYLIWRVLAALNASKQACAWGSILFMCCPIGFEAFLWASAIATGVATSMLLGSILLYIRHARRELSRAGYVTLTLLAGSIPLMNEQPAACLAALPLLAMAMRREDEPWRRTIWHAVMPLIIPALMHGAYLWNIAANLPQTSYGSMSSLVPLEALPRRIAVIAKQMTRELRGDTLGLGAFRVGLKALANAWPMTLLMGGAIVAAVVLSAKRWVDLTPSKRQGANLTSRVWLLLFVLAMGVLTHLPLAAVGWVMVRPRMAYVTLAALALLVGVVGNALRDLVISRNEGPRQTWARTYERFTGVSLITLALVGVTTLIGVQAGYVARSRADRASLEHIRTLIGEPAPDTFFLPLAVENRAVDSGTPQFDWYFASAWYWSYAFPTFARQGLGRSDVESGFAVASRPLLANVDEHGFVFDGPTRYDAGRAAGTRRVAWEDVVAFEVGFDGVVTLLSPVRLERDGVVVGAITIPHVEAARVRGAAAVRAWTIEVD